MAPKEGGDMEILSHVIIYALGIAATVFFVVMIYAALKISSDEDERREREHKDFMEIQRKVLEHRLQQQAERGLQERGNEVTSEDTDTPR